MPLSNPAVGRYAQSPSVLLLLAIYCAFAPLSHSQDVLTYHNNNARTGLKNNEKILTQTNVTSATFGKLFTVSADGKVDAEPLYLSAVKVAGAARNLLIVATEHDSVYAYDAETGAKIWQRRTLKAGETPSDHRGCGQVSPEIGITSTPVIWRTATGNPVIYVVAMSKDSSGKYHQRLHALDATTGSELHNGPVEIEAKYPGTRVLPRRDFWWKEHPVPATDLGECRAGPRNRRWIAQLPSLSGELGRPNSELQRLAGQHVLRGVQHGHL
jgi:outer membrane protein assembly factor BamB